MNIPHIYQTLGWSCGPTSAAMVLSYITGKNVTEKDVCDWCYDKYYNGVGSDLGIFKAAAQKWGAGSVKQTSDVETVRTALMRWQTSNCICAY